MKSRMILCIPPSASTNGPTNSSTIRYRRFPSNRDARHASTTNTSATERATCLPSSSRTGDGDTSSSPNNAPSWMSPSVFESWLNMVEIEFSALVRQCLSRRLPDINILSREIAAWESARNAAQVKTDWRFTARDARTTLARHYPMK